MAEPQRFRLDRTPHEAMDSAEQFLFDTGKVVPALEGLLERRGDHIAIHHGRIKTIIQVFDAEAGTDVEIRREGRPPLETTRRALLGLGLMGFLAAWGLTVYDDSATFSPFATMALLLLGTVLSMAVLFVADRSLEKRSMGFIESLEDAMRGDPRSILAREVTALERSASMANGFLFYCGALLVEFIIFVTLLSDGVRDGIDAAVATDVMRTVFLLPILPAIAFAFITFQLAHRGHVERMASLDP